MITAPDPTTATPTATATLPEPLPLDFVLDADHEAHEPPEAHGTARDQVNLLVSAGTAAPVISRFDHLPGWLRAGDLLVVNTSATVAAAVDLTTRDGRPVVLHRSSELPGGLWMVEPRRRIANGSTAPLVLAPEPITLLGPDGWTVDLLRPLPGSTRLWMATTPADQPLAELTRRHGRPIRYRYVERDWPLDAYASVFGSLPGSAEMPSASRPFTPDLVARLVAAGIGFAPITLHTGVSSLEGHELPYPERYEVPAATAAYVNAAHAVGRRVIAVGTTVVRALETVADAQGNVHPGGGWTDAVITPARGVRAVDGLISGWHEPAATHLAMLEAVLGRDPLVAAYRAAFAAGFRWHEFGDSHLLLP